MRRARLVRASTRPHALTLRKCPPPAGFSASRTSRPSPASPTSSRRRRSSCGSGRLVRPALPSLQPSGARTLTCCSSALADCRRSPRPRCAAPERARVGLQHEPDGVRRQGPERDPQRRDAQGGRRQQRRRLLSMTRFTTLASWSVWLDGVPVSARSACGRGGTLTAGGVSLRAANAGEAARRRPPLRAAFLPSLSTPTLLSSPSPARTLLTRPSLASMSHRIGFTVRVVRLLFAGRPKLTSPCPAARVALVRLPPLPLSLPAPADQVRRAHELVPLVRRRDAQRRPHLCLG